MSGGNALLLSRYVIEAKPYHSELEESSWEESTVRTWLNTDFYNLAFAEAEFEVVEKELKNDVGAATEDKVFLLSKEEAEYYFSSDESKIAKATDCAIAHGVYEFNNFEGDYENLNRNCRWWLRSSNLSDGGALWVNALGEIDVFGYRANTVMVGVRPAMWVKIK